MWDKIKGFIDLKGLLLAGSFIVALVTTYNTVGSHSQTLQKHENFLGKNYSQIMQQDKALSMLSITVDSIEKRQNNTDSKLEALTNSIQTLNNTMIKLTTIMENKK
ncbi:TPA: hypothetical protein ACUNCG_000446 [Aeromonas hydrophila]